MLTQTSAFRNMGMRKGARLPHTQTPHNGTISAVAERGEGYGFLQLEHLETDAKSLRSGFRSKPFVPMLKRKTPPRPQCRERKGVPPMVCASRQNQ